MRVEARRFGRGPGEEDPGAGTRAAFTGACKALAEVAAPYLEVCYGRVFRVERSWWTFGARWRG